MSGGRVGLEPCTGRWAVPILFTEGASGSGPSTVGKPIVDRLTDRQTDMIDNITSPQLHWQAVTMSQTWTKIFAVKFHLLYYTEFDYFIQ